MFDVTESVASVGKKGHVRETRCMASGKCAVSYNKKLCRCLHAEAQLKEGSEQRDAGGFLSVWGVLGILFYFCLAQKQQRSCS